MNTRKFKSLLVENGLNYETFAQKIGVEKHVISYMVRTKDLKVSLLVVIAEALNVEPSVLINK
jgi:DNA-binding Xre family transcriptional regulator